MSKYIHTIKQFEGKQYLITGIHEGFGMFYAVEFGRNFKTLIPWDVA